MLLKIYPLLAEIVIFCSVCRFSNAKPMVGENVMLISEGNLNLVVSITKNNFGNIEVENDHIASGVLVSKRDVLLTAHPLNPIPETGFQVIVGSNDIRTGMKFNPFWWITFDEWAAIHHVPVGTRINDLCIVRLIDNVPDTIVPAVISPLPVEQLYENTVLVAAWGQVEDGSYSRYLRSATLTVISNDRCEQRMKLLRGMDFVIPKNLICSIKIPYVIMTPGDSGGPVFYEGQLVAIHKATCLYPNEFINPNKINIHLSLDFYRSFIEHAINNL